MSTFSPSGGCLVGHSYGVRFSGPPPTGHELSVAASKMLVYCGGLGAECTLPPGANVSGVCVGFFKRKN